MTRLIPTLLTTASLALLAGCASLSSDGNTGEIANLSAGPMAGPRVQLSRDDDEATRTAVQALLANPLDADAAVRVALLNNPGLHASLAALGISDAERVQAGRPPNPHLALGRMVEGGKVEIERGLSFDVLGIFTLPWRARAADRQHELAKLEAAQDVVRLAASTRKAWVEAVAAQQTAAYMADAKEAAEASGELARRMARVGNWSRLQQAREQLFLADATAQLARAQQAAVRSREKLTRLMGLWGTQVQYRLPARLPDLPAAPADLPDVEARALRGRLDVRAAVASTRHLADSMGLQQVSGYLDGLTLGYVRNTTFDNAAGTKEIKRGWEVEIPLPLFDWGGARHARAQAVYMQSAARVREVAVNARSEAREAYHAARTAWDIARHARDELVPLRKFISEETLLRYNGMLLGVFDLLADTRAQILTVNSAIEAQRDYWLAETDLQMVLSGTSPGGIAALTSSPGLPGGQAKGH